MAVERVLVAGHAEHAVAPKPGSVCERTSLWSVIARKSSPRRGRERNSLADREAERVRLLGAGVVVVRAAVGVVRVASCGRAGRRRATRRPRVGRRGERGEHRHRNRRLIRRPPRCEHSRPRAPRRASRRCPRRAPRRSTVPTQRAVRRAAQVERAARRHVAQRDRAASSPRRPGGTRAARPAAAAGSQGCSAVQPLLERVVEQRVGDAAEQVAVCAVEGRATARPRRRPRRAAAQVAEERDVRQQRGGHQRVDRVALVGAAAERRAGRARTPARTGSGSRGCAAAGRASGEPFWNQRRPARHRLEREQPVVVGLVDLERDLGVVGAAAGRASRRSASW